MLVTIRLRAFGVIAEQAVSSGGSFAFLFLAARALAPEGFATFASVWAVVQFLLSISMASHLLPMASMVVDDDRLEPLFGACFYRHAVLCALSLVACPLALMSVAGAGSVATSIVGECWALSCVFLTVEAVRFLFVRTGDLASATVLNSLKWGGAVAGVVFLDLQGGVDTRDPVRVLTISSAVALVFGASRLKASGCSIEVARGGCARHVASFSRPLLTQYIANAIASLLYASAIGGFIGQAAFGAFQAIRGLGNVVSPLIQGVHAHYSARLVRASGVPFLGAGEFMAAIAGAAAVAVTVFGHGTIVSGLLSDEYSPFSWLLPFVVAHNTALLLLGLAGAKVRWLGDTSAFNYTATVSFASSIVVFAVGFACNSFQLVAWIFAVAPVFQYWILARAVWVGLRRLEAAKNSDRLTDGMPLGRT